MTSSLIGLEPTVASFVAALLNAVWQGVVLFAMVWLALHIIRFANATTRYAIWLAGLISICLLPLTNLAVPLEDNEERKSRVESESTRPKELLSTAEPMLVVRPRGVVKGEEHRETKPFAEERPLEKRAEAYEVVSLDDVNETACGRPFCSSDG